MGCPIYLHSGILSSDVFSGGSQVVMRWRCGSQVVMGFLWWS